MSIKKAVAVASPTPPLGRGLAVGATVQAASVPNERTRHMKRKLSKTAAAFAAATAISVGGVVTATPAAAHSGAHGVVAEHGGPGWSQYHEVVYGKGTTHWADRAPTRQVARWFVQQVRAKTVRAPRWVNLAAVSAAGSYAASTKVRIWQAEREGICFSMVKMPYSNVYWPAKTTWGCR